MLSPKNVATVLLWTIYLSGAVAFILPIFKACSWEYAIPYIALAVGIVMLIFTTIELRLLKFFDAGQIVTVGLFWLTYTVCITLATQRFIGEVCSASSLLLSLMWAVGGIASYLGSSAVLRSSS